MAATVILIASGKGGVGKSSVCAGVAFHLARMGRKTLVLEVGSGTRCMDLLLGVAEQAVFDLSDVLTGRCEPIKAIYASPLEDRLYMMPSTLHPDTGYQPNLFHKLCKGLRGYYDFILIEAPAGFGAPLGELAAVSNRALLVVTPDPVAVRGARTMSDYLDTLGLTVQHLVVNQVRTLYGRLLVLPHLDAVIDAVLEPLIGVIPYEMGLSGQLTRGEMVPQSCVAGQAMANIASRLTGEFVDLAMW